MDPDPSQHIIHKRSSHASKISLFDRRTEACSRHLVFERPLFDRRYHAVCPSVDGSDRTQLQELTHH